MEAIPLKNATETKILCFLEELITKFSPPKTIILDNAKAFLGSQVTQFTLNHGVYLKISSNYHPQGNGLVESTNKNPIRLVKRIGVEYKREWHRHLKSVL